MKKAISIIFISAILITLSGCVSDSDYQSLEQRVAYLESLHNIDATQNIDKPSDNATQHITAISVNFDYDTGNKGTFGEVYSLSIIDDKVRFYYMDIEAGKDYLCDVSMDKFNEIAGLFDGQAIEPYEDPVDASGKILHQRVDHMITLRYEDYSVINIQDPANFDQIMQAFTELKKAVGD